MSLSNADYAVLYAAVALHPGMKFGYFEINWAEHPDCGLKMPEIKLKRYSNPSILFNP